MRPGDAFGSAQGVSSGHHSTDIREARVLRYLTAGESHGPALVAILEGLPAGVPVSGKAIASELARRRGGHGRGERMSIEADRIEILSGVRHGRSLGSPIALKVANSEWAKWSVAMAAEEVSSRSLARLERAKPLTRPRPGHADLVGMLKYGFEDARNVLERASARETAARVGVGSVAKQFLGVLGIEVASHVISIGSVRSSAAHPGPGGIGEVDASPVRCADAAASRRMMAAIDQARAKGDTLGGVFEILVFSAPVGLGSYAQWDRRLDARLAGALMGIPAIKGVEIGEGFRIAALPGSRAHDEIVRRGGGYERKSARAGGIEGGMSNGQTLRLRAAMKPIPTLGRPLTTVDMRTGLAAEAHHQRSDVCAVPAAGVVGEAVVALVVADAVLEKTGGDSLEEVRRNLEAYLASIGER